MQSMTRDKYQLALNKYAENHAKDTTRKFNSQIRACVRDAIDDGVIMIDFTRKVVLDGKNPTKKSQEKFINFSDLQKLLKVTLEDVKPTYTSRYFIIIAAATGARFGEILGLTWDDVNFEEKTIDINKTLDYKTHSGFSTTKNEHSIRKIKIDSNTIKIMKSYKKAQDELIEKTGIENTNNLVLFNVLKKTITNEAVNKSLKKMCNRVGCKEITAHGLRHTHASILLYKKVSIYTVAKRLGHKDTTVTQETYAHVIKELEEEEELLTIDILEELTT